MSCAATPAGLMESVMFGHERGSFTGAFRRQRGLFEVVGAGTLLLDEVAEVPVGLQSKLLRAVEDRFFQPIGAEDEVSFTGRILASTNADLDNRMQSGRFRPDLYYRLGVLLIRVPALAERAEDIPDLVSAFVRCAERPIELTPGAIDWLSERSWPGNVRELRNAVQRLSVLCPAGKVGLADVVEHVGDTPARTSANGIDRAARILTPLSGNLADKLGAVEKSIVLETLRQAGGNRSAAARTLGVHRRVIDRVAPSTPDRRNRRGTARDS